MNEKKSIIEKVVSDRELKKKNEEKNQIELEQKKQEIMTKTSEFLNEIYNKINNYPPDFSPIGKWLKKANWNVSQGKIEVKGEASNILSKKLITLECILCDITTIEQLNLIINKRVYDATQTDQYISTCFIIPYLENKEFIDIITNYNHYNFSPSLFDLSTQEFFYNDNDWKTSFFIKWFKTGDKPENIINYLEQISDENNIFLKSQVLENLHMDEKEIKKMFDWLIKSNKIIHLKMDEFTVMK